VDRLGGEVLAGAGLPRQQHRGRGTGRHLRQQLLHPRHGRRGAHDGVEPEVATLAAAQRHHFTAQRHGLERLLGEQQHLVEVERLVDVVERTELHRLDRVLDGRKRGHQDHRQIRRALFDLPQHRQAVAVRQLEVEKDQIDVVPRLVHGFFGGGGLDDVVPLGGQPFAQRPPHQLLVVDDQNSRESHDRQV
jgi:hypothetical protein